jgi:putative transposase
MMISVAEAVPALGTVGACLALGVSRASFRRWQAPMHGPHPRRRSPRALTKEERDHVLSLLHEDRFADQAPREVAATLMYEGKRLCSISTMYRVLRENCEVRERRDQLRHPAYAAPELLAEAPNQVWSWDITKLKGPEKWSYFHLYVILDIYSRYIVGWMVANRESAVLAERLIALTCKRQGIAPGQLTLHADRGSSMRSQGVAELLVDLGVLKSHSRPYVSDDNPYSESQFKTLKYRPDFPERFGSLQDARSHFFRFDQWYNHEHHHSGIADLTPADVHFGRAAARLEDHQRVLDAAYAAHPERFVHGPPRAPELPMGAWINKPIVVSENERDHVQKKE